MPPIGHASAPRSANIAPTPYTTPTTRAGLIELAGSGHPWTAAPALAAALRDAPGDVGLRFLLARTLACLGLATLARGQLAALPEAARALDEARALVRDIDALPGDREPQDARAERARAGVAALITRGVDLREYLDGWQRAPTPRFIARDGNAVVLPDHANHPHEWRDLADRRAEARAAAGRLVTSLAGAAPGPITVDGASPPWLLAELLERIEPTATGYRPQIVLVEEDPAALLDALSMPGSGAWASSDRLRIFVGPDAAGEYTAWARARFELESLGPVVASSASPGSGRGRMHEIAESVRREQQAELSRVRARVEGACAGRDARWWAERYERARRPGTDEPLRVLIPTCRYTTFVHHAAEDLRGAFERTGANARTLVEPDAHARLSAIGYLAEVERFAPDLVVLINYPRATRPGAFPPGVPFACWIQDQMPHLLDERVGRSHSPLDFVCGHLYPDLFERFAYPIDRALAVPVVIDPTKFHDAPAPRGLLDESACEIAYVSHQSETPESMRDRLACEAGDDRIARVIAWAHDRVTALAPQAHTLVIAGEVARELPRVLHDALGGAPDPGVAARLKAQCIDPLGERVLRHQTLRWAAAIAARRGWRLRIHGRGWADGPFARYARPELPHGEPLRASYQSAAVHLHASPSTAVHQRVMECAASGGLPLCRLTHQMLASQALADAVKRGARADSPTPVADSPALMDWCAQHQRLGMGSPTHFTAPAAALDRQRPFVPTGKLDWTARWLLGDFSQTTFWSEQSLERLVERAVTRPAWRENVSGGIRARVCARATTDALAASITRMVHESLGASPTAAAAA